MKHAGYNQSKYLATLKNFHTAVNYIFLLLLSSAKSYILCTATELNGKAKLMKDGMVALIFSDVIMIEIYINIII